MKNLTIVRLKKGKEAATLRKHAWIFSGAIQHIEGNAKDGDLVHVSDYKGTILATGFYFSGSIAVKIIAFEAVTLTVDFWISKLKAAWNLRQTLGLTHNAHTNCFRLIHAESDEIPGLILDIYDGNWVLQIHHAGILNEVPNLYSAIEKSGLPCNGIYIRTAEKGAGKSTFEMLKGNQTHGVVKEHGILFEIDWEKGQKTGFFLDQRENRLRVKALSAGKKVLNTFCYTGGFSLYALAGGASEVHSIDSSAWAMEQVTKNIALNNLDSQKHTGITGDALPFLSQNTHVYDLIILDPPAFAKSMHARHNAIQAYKRINQLAMRQIQPGGLLFTFSCSQVVDKYMFTQTVLSAAIEANREVKIVEQLHQPGDHPVRIFHPESEYLKGLVVYVE